MYWLERLIMNLFENLSSEEKKLLSAYDEMAKSANFNRSDEEIFFDKISLLGGARLLVNTTRKGRIIDDEYIKTKIMQLKKILQIIPQWKILVR